MTNNLKALQNNIISLCKLGSSIITNLDMSHMRGECILITLVMCITFVNLVFIVSQYTCVLVCAVLTSIHRFSY